MAEPILRIGAIDAHVAGAVVRLVSSGFPVPRGERLADRDRWLAKRHDRLCRALVLEPRGHEGVTLALLLEPVTPGADAAVLFRHASGSAGLCGHGLIGALTIAVERHLLVPRDRARVRVDTLGGIVEARVELAKGADPARVERVRYVGPPALVLAGGLPIHVGQRVVPVDLAWAGECFAIVDGESAGVPLVRARLGDVRAAAAALTAAVERAAPLVHPATGRPASLAGVVFTGPPERPESLLRCQVIYADGTADRSPSGTGVAATTAVIAAMGLDAGEPFVVESLSGLTLSGQVIGEAKEPAGAVEVEIAGSGWITAEHTFVIDPTDPLREGMAW